MKPEKIIFTGSAGLTLAGRIDFPADRKPKAFAVLTHCFTCNKSFKAMSYVTRYLTNHGFGVMRFDFMGLGESEGDFADSNFSQYVDDVLLACKFLEEQYESPQLLVGHSIGGAAVLAAAGRYEPLKAVATIGAPSDPQHLEQHVADHIEDILSDGEAEVSIGGRPFTVKKQFLEDLEQQDLPRQVRKMDKALLIFHAPQDATVDIHHAEVIFKAAKHPKSFVSLDQADHLVTNEQHAKFLADVLAGWACGYIDVEMQEVPIKPVSGATVGWTKGGAFRTEIYADGHHLVADEPESVGGDDFGPSPFLLVSAGLAACTNMTLKMYAERKDLPLESVTVHITHDVTREDKHEVHHFKRKLTIQGDFDPDKKERMRQIADRCPVHRMLEGEVHIETELEEN